MAWSIVGVGTSVEVTATAHALTVPAGVAAGDLLVACIASRIASTTSVTLPTGGEWTLVSEQKANNVLSTGSAVASAMMAYCVRGASDPNLTFTHPTAPAPALGRIVAYRGGATPTASAKDTQTSLTTAVSITAVNLTGLTTTQADDLIVAMLAGGQEAAWSIFKSANAPTTASGATDTTTAPSTTTWIERADVQTTTSNDTSLGIFDAVKTAAGATGNFTATASVAASHALVAGAFKIAPVSVTVSVTGQSATASVGTATVTIVNPTADAWSATDKSSGVTLSDSDKTATFNIGANRGIRSTTKHLSGTAGKYYAELLLTTVAGSGDVYGIQNATAGLTSTSGGTIVVEAGQIYHLDTFVGDIGSSFANGDVFCVAWDAGAERIWFRKNGGNWNDSGTANPATGAGGIDTSTADNVDHALWHLYQTGASAVTTLRTELAEFTQTVPSGFTSWMGETPAGGGISVSVTGVSATGSVGTVTVATGGNVSVSVTSVSATGAVGTVTATGVGVTADTWNPADKTAGITLSNGDRTATVNTAANSGVRAVTSRANGTAGKYYAELVMDTATVADFMGITPKANAINSTATNFLVRASDGVFLINSVATGGFGAALAVNDVVCIAWDAGAEMVWFRRNGGNWNNTSGHDPATATGGIDCSFAASTDHNIWLRGGSVGDGATLRTTLAGYTQSVPSGFTSWMGETPATGAVTVSVTGVSGTGAIGTATITTVANVDVPVTGVSGAGAAGDVAISGQANASITGVAATGAVGTVAVVVPYAPPAERQYMAGSPYGAVLVSESGDREFMVASTYVAETSAAPAAAVNVTVSVTGVSATGAVDTVTTTGKANVSVTGVSGAGAIDTVSVVGKANTQVTNVAGTGTIGTVIVAGKAVVSAAGVTGTGAAGTVTVSTVSRIDVVVSPTGVQGTGTVGTATVTANQTVAVPITGVSGAGSIGTVSVAGKATATLSGVSGAGAIGTTTVSLPTAFSITGVSAAGSAGTATIVGKSNVTAPGISGTGAAGTVSVTGGTGVASLVTGVQGVGTAGSPTITGKANISLTGVAGVGLAGSVSITAGGSVSTGVAGVQGTGQVGTVIITAKQTVAFPVTGVSAAGSAGTVTIAAKANVSAPGVVATGAAGTPIVTGKANVSAPGVQGAGTIGVVSVSAAGAVSVPSPGVQAIGTIGTVTITAKRFVSVPLPGVSAAGAAGPVTVTAIELAGLVGVWTGTAWVQKPTKVWTGSAWVRKPAKVWNGSAWAA